MLLAIGVGALLMFYLDPARGRRRRALVRDKFVRAGHATAEAFEGTRRDLGNRLEGARARWQRLGRHETVDDDTLRERVRAQLGHYITNVDDVAIDIADGCVTLSGHVDARQARPLVRAISRVPGVCDVTSRLTSDGMPVTGGRRVTVPVMLLVATGAAVAARNARLR